jgi:AcrR family transcriptional regulator
VPRDKTATHLKVLEAAREEFMEYGYENASMRRIGQRCGMTAAGLYRHCRDKAGLFGELVSPSIDKINEWIEGHISRGIHSMETEAPGLVEGLRDRHDAESGLPQYGRIPASADKGQGFSL